MKHNDLIAPSWPDYELIDSGDNRKLERFGKIILIRPETQAIWKPARPGEWKKSQAEFRFDGGKGSWQKKGIPDEWEMSWHDARFTLRLTSFKHTGIFPEQASNWEWIAERVGVLKKSRPEPPRVLNLFGYTGIASIVAAQHGAVVTHADASKQSNTWAKDNAARSGIPQGGIRYLLEDALAFVNREVRRGNMYDGIILDPPSFGRGPDGEMWRIEEHIVPLLEGIKKIFNNKPGSFFLLNGYAAGYAPQSFLQALESAFPGATKLPNGEFGELRIKESGSDRVIPAGIYVRFTL